MKKVLILLALTISAVGAVYSQSCYPAPSGLVSWWQAEGNAGDSIGSNNGILESGVEFGPGEVGQAFIFNNTNADVKIPASASLDVGTGGGFTIEGWIDPVSLTSQPIIAEWNNGSWWGAHFGIPNYSGTGTLYANIVDTSGNWHQLWTSTPVITTNVFQHVAVTYDKESGVATLYVNGAVVAQQTLGSFTPQTSYDLYLGRRIAGDFVGAAFDGTMDEMSLYNRALSGPEIEAIYEAGAAGKCSSLVAPYIVTQPANQTVTVGKTATFTVKAGGTPPLFYQWSFDGTNILNQTNATLTLANVQPDQAGNYAVQVANVVNSTNSVSATLTVNPLPPCTPAPSGLVAWWPGETNMDDIVNDNDGTAHGNLTYNIGEVGYAFALDGSSYITVPASSTLNIGANGTGITIEGWINPSANNTGGPIIEWDSSSADGLQFWADGDNTLWVNIKKDPNNAYGLQTASGVISNNVWQHVAVTYDKSSGEEIIYVNGVEVASKNFGTLTPETTYPVNIGIRTGEPIGNGDTYTGMIDELSLYNRALSSNEIAAVYLAGSGGKCLAPVAPYIITQPTNQTVTVGGTATFTVKAGGAPPLFYQWSFEGTNILNQTNATLTLNNVQFDQAGGYAVQVANTVDSTNSVSATLTVNPPPSCTPAPSGLVAWWQAEGNADDEIGSDNGILESGVEFGPGEVGQAFIFNNTNADVKIPASASLDVGTGGGFTIEGWIDPVSLTSQPIIAEWNNGSWWGAHFGIPNYSGTGTLYANIVDTSGNWHQLWTSTPVITTNVFQHVAVTYDKESGVATLYVNGAVVAQQTLGSFTPQTSYDLYLGRRIAGDFVGAAFDGTMDEMSLYNRALSGPEIEAIYEAGVIGKCVPMLPPTIVAQPTNQMVAAGGTVTFGVDVIGTAPLSYQWSFDGTNILNQTNATLTLINAQPGQTGNYSVQIANAFGSTNSVNASLTVNTPPVADATATIPLAISLNGSNAAVVLDGSRSFDLDGDTLQYAWFNTGSTNVLTNGIVAVVTLPLGTNSITLRVSDGFASDSQTITVEVITTSQAVNRLIAATDDASTKQSLLAVLEAALASIDRSHPTSAINQLQAFQNQVSAQLGPIDPVAAQALIDEAQTIIDSLTGSGGAPANVHITPNASGKLHLSFSGRAGQIYIIEASSDMKNWEKIGVAHAQTNGVFIFDDNDAAKMTGRFYRVVVP